jgi:hypothetical protein
MVSYAGNRHASRRLLSRTCEQTRVVWAEGRQAWVEMALSNEVYKRRLAFAEWWADAAPAEQLMGQSNLVFALDEAGWQVSKSHDELSVRPGQVCLDGLAPALTLAALSSLHCSGYLLGSAVPARTTPASYPPADQSEWPNAEGARLHLATPLSHITVNLHSNTSRIGNSPKRTAGIVSVHAVES